MRKTIFTLVSTAIGFVLDIWRSFVGVKFYGWFVLPLFPTLPAISVMAMFGIILFVSIVNGSSSKLSDDEDQDKMVERTIAVMISGIIFPLIMLVLGAIVKFLL